MRLAVGEAFRSGFMAKPKLTSLLMRAAGGRSVDCTQDLSVASALCRT